NYLADSDLNSSYQVTVPGNATIVVVVEEFTENAGCPSYTVTVDGLGSCPSPTPTATPTVTPSCSPGPLWYNGDFDNVNGLGNGNNTGFTAATYDNFIVPAGPGWDVSSVYTNNLLSTSAGITTANWEIRSGVSEGNGGTLIASASGSPAVVTFKGPGGFGFTEYTVRVNGLNVHLAPGTYWLSVQPNGNGSQISYNSSTVGLNCIGLPCGNDDNAFFNSSTFGYNFHTTTDPAFGPGNIDFSMGVDGTAGCGPTPTPT